MNTRPMSPAMCKLEADLEYRLASTNTPMDNITFSRELAEQLLTEIRTLYADRANRYWEGRYRDEKADNERLRAAGQRALDHYDMRSEVYTDDADVGTGMASILRAALQPKP